MMLIALLVGVATGLVAAAAVAWTARRHGTGGASPDDGAPLFGAMLLAFFLTVIVAWMLAALAIALLQVGPVALLWVAAAFVIAALAVWIGERAWRDRS